MAKKPTPNKVAAKKPAAMVKKSPLKAKPAVQPSPAAKKPATKTVAKAAVKPTPKPAAKIPLAAKTAPAPLVKKPDPAPVAAVAATPAPLPSARLAPKTTLATAGSLTLSVQTSQEPQPTGTRTQPISWSSSPAVGNPSWISTKITSHSWSILRSVDQAPPSATASPLSAMPAQEPTCSRPGPAAVPPGAAATTSASSLSLQTTTARAKLPSRSSSVKNSHSRQSHFIHGV